jgi:hypothetical protein
MPELSTREAKVGQTDDDDPLCPEGLCDGSREQSDRPCAKDGDDLAGPDVCERADRVDADGQGLDHRALVERDGLWQRVSQVGRQGVIPGGRRTGGVRWEGNACVCTGLVGRETHRQSVPRV